jgi:MraZ protein
VVESASKCIEVGNFQWKEVKKTMLFKGEYEHSIDPKGRVFIPAKFREGLGDSFVVCKWFFAPCLYVFSDEEFESLSSRLDDLPFADEDASIIQTELYANAMDVEVDKQGRILLSSSLREYAQLEKEVVVIGARRHVEIWDKATWKSRRVDSDRLREAVQNLRNQGIRF